MNRYKNISHIIYAVVNMMNIIHHYTEIFHDSVSINNMLSDFRIMMLVWDKDNCVHEEDTVRNWKYHANLHCIFTFTKFIKLSQLKDLHAVCDTSKTVCCTLERQAERWQHWMMSEVWQHVKQALYQLFVPGDQTMRCVTLNVRLCCLP